MSSSLPTLSGPGTSINDRETQDQVPIRTSEPATDNRFRITGLLGEGGMNRVYLGTDAETGETVAIRAFEHAKAESPANRKKRMSRMAREADMMRKIDHPNFPRFIRCIEDQNGDGYIVLEQIKGKELTHIIESSVESHQGVRPRGSVVPWDVIVAVTRQLFAALQKLDDLGMVHRDIKPANIMYEKVDGGILMKVIDFGLGKILEGTGEDSLTHEGDMMGSGEYMAPEQTVNAKGVDRRADLYSVGAVLYEMVTGRKAVDLIGVTSHFQVFARLQAEFKEPLDPKKYPREFVKDMNPLLEQFILDLLERDPDKRPANATEALARFEAAIASEVRTGSMPSAPIISTPPPASSPAFNSVPPVVPMSGNRSRGFAIAIIVFLAAACMVVYATFKWRSSSTTATSSASARAVPSAVPLTPSATPVATTSAVPSVSVPIVTLVRKDQLSNQERATLKAAEAQLKSGGECQPLTKRALIDITKKWANLPDAYYWLAECANRLKEESSEAHFRKEYARLTGGNTGPP